MSSITRLSATAIAPNTGTRGVPEVLGRIGGVVFVPKGKIVLTADLAAPSTTIRALFLNNTPSLRGYPIGPVGEVTDGTTETVKVSWAYGYEFSVALGKYVLTLHPNTLDERVFDIMQKFNGKGHLYDCFLVDENYKWIGTYDSTGLQALNVSDIFTDARRLHGNDIAKPGIRIVLGDSTQLNNSNMREWATGYNAIVDEYRVDNVVIEQVTAVDSSRVVVVRAMLGATNLATTADAASFDQVGAWKGIKDADGAVIAATAVSRVTVNGETCYSITMSLTNYPSSAATWTLTLHSLSTLSGLSTPIYGYEVLSGDELVNTAA